MFIRNEYELLNQMLDSAINGHFEEGLFDETELSKLQSKLMRYLTSASMSEKKLNEEKDNLKELITNISHQTKTPLTNILMYSELLNEQAIDANLKEYSQEIYTQGKKLEVLIEALVKMSRLETGILQFEKKQEDLGQIARAVISQGQPKAKEKAIEIIEGPLEDIAVSVDKKWLSEAIYNILDNAIKYSPNNSKITIETYTYELFSGIRISDEGMGISEEEIPRIFARFYRGSQVRDKDGIGVGLFLAREIVEGHGGYIKVKSERAKGSVFDIALPNISKL